jgi:hypothetical protein
VFISVVIHSRACWVEEYSVAGRLPSRTRVAFLVTLTAKMSWPCTVRPMVTSLVNRGYCRLSSINSSRMPPGSL